MFRKAYSILTPKEKRDAVKSAAATVASTLLDLAGLAALLPALYWILDSGAHSKTLSFCLLALALIILKGGCGIYLARYVDRFCMQVYRRLSLDLYSAYYLRGYSFLRSNSSARLAYEVNSVCMTFATGILLSAMTVAGDLLLLLVSVTALAFWSPATAAVLVVSFLPIVIVWNGLVRKRLSFMGEKEKSERQSQWGSTIETFDGYCELETTGSFPRFRSDFIRRLDSISGLHSATHAIMLTPAMLSELCAVLGLTLMVAVGGSDVRMMIGVFALAAFRLLPALRQLMGNVSRFRNSEYAVGILSEALDDTHRRGSASGSPDTNSLSFSDRISVCDLHFSYPGGMELFGGLDLTIRKGEYLGIRGMSGCGKTSLILLLMGFLSPSAGSVSADGIPLHNTDTDNWKKRFGYVSQDVFLFDSSVMDNILMGRGNIDCDWLAFLTHSLGLRNVIDRGTIRKTDRYSGESVVVLSGGERQRVGIARALASFPDILVLDEATSALDADTEKKVMDFIADLHRLHPEMTIISISHRESTLAPCDRIINL